jgi:hypothetical protein
MHGGSVYKDNTFNKETAPTSHETARTSHENSTIHLTKQHVHLTKTAQYIARIFTVQYKYMNIAKHSKNINYRRKHKRTEENKIKIQKTTRSILPYFYWDLFS